MRPMPATIGATLTGAAALLRGETSSPELDAELLLASVMKQPREFVLSHRETPLSSREQRAFASLVRRRAEGIPLPYLMGTKEWYGRTFRVTPAVLIPRAETEAIVEEARTLLDETSIPHPIVADIGTGSGVIAVSIAAEASRTRVVATDASAAALVVARQNARRHKVSRRVTFIKSDLLTEIPPELSPNLIVANLPYVTSEHLQYAADHLDTLGLTFEPQKALDGGPDGLFVIRRFFAQVTRAPRIKKTLQSLILEHSPAQRRRILELAHDALPDFKPHEVSPFVTSWSRISP